MVKSIINLKYEFDEEVWIVSVLNTGSRLTGHSIIVVEGIINNSNSLHKELFVGQYDIKFIPYAIQDSSVNIKGYVSRIDIFENNRYTREYSQYQAKSYCANPIYVKAMIKSIKQDKDKVQQLEMTMKDKQVAEEEIDSTFIKQHGFLEYQRVGKNSLLADDGAGDNCAGWALEKLAIAGIGDGTGKPTPGKVAGGCLII